MSSPPSPRHGRSEDGQELSIVWRDRSASLTGHMFHNLEVIDSRHDEKFARGIGCSYGITYRVGWRVYECRYTVYLIYIGPLRINSLFYRHIYEY